QRQCAPGFFGHDRLDSGEADLAAVSQAEGAPIDDLDDAAFALRFERASRGVGRTSGDDNKHETARRNHRDPFAAAPCSPGHAFHDAALCPDQLLYAGDPQTCCLSEIALVTRGPRWKSTASRIFFSPHPILNARANSTENCCRFSA